MKIVLDGWQRDILDYRGDMLLCAGRRVGKTYILARKAIERMIEKKTDVIIFSLTEEQSMIILSMAQTYLLETAPRLLCTKKIDTNKKTLTLKNGSKMKCRPAGDTGDSGRGFEGIVDEAARMGKLFWIAILPIVLMKAGEVWLASTPFGKQGYFWDRFNESYNLKDPEARYKVFYVTTEQVIKERAITPEWTEAHREKVIKILEQDKKTMTNSQYGQEYLGLFVQDLQNLFSEEWINKVCVKKRRSNIIAGRYYLGVDVAGFGKDLNSFEIIEKPSKEKYVQVENLTTSRKLSTETANKIIELNQLYNPKKIGIDDMGVGFGVFSILFENPKTRKKTEALNNSKRETRELEDKQETKKLLKEEMYIRLQSLGDAGKLFLLDDETIKLSLSSIQWEILERDSGKSEVRIFGNNSHIVEGIIRAVWLASEDKSLNIWCSWG
jgi:hypothetical protein